MNEITINGFTGTPEALRAFFAAGVPYPAPAPVEQVADVEKVAPANKPDQTPPSPPVAFKQTELPFRAPDKELDALIGINETRKRKIMFIFDFLPRNGMRIQTGIPFLRRLKAKGLPVYGRSETSERQQVTDLLTAMEECHLILRDTPKGHWIRRNPKISREEAILAVAELAPNPHGKLVTKTA